MSRIEFLLDCCSNIPCYMVNDLHYHNPQYTDILQIDSYIVYGWTRLHVNYQQAIGRHLHTKYLSSAKHKHVQV